MRPRVAVLFAALALLVVADVLAIVWLDAHELEVIGLATGFLLLIWLGVVVTDPAVERTDE